MENKATIFICVGIIGFSLAVVIALLISKRESPRNTYQGFFADFEQGFTSKSTELLDLWFTDKTEVKYQNLTIMYSECKNNVQNYINSKNHLVGGSITSGSVRLIENSDGSISFSIESEGYYNYPSFSKSVMEINVIIGADKKVTLIKSESPLFGYIFIGIPME